MLFSVRTERKTTLVNIIFGLYTADSGEILWKDKPADFASPREAIDAGIGMVQQHFSLVNKMTVLDNIVLNLKDNSFSWTELLQKRS